MGAARSASRPGPENRKPAGRMSCGAGGTSLPGSENGGSVLRAQGPRGESYEELTQVGVGREWCGGCSERRRGRGHEDECGTKKRAVPLPGSSEDLPL